MLPDLPVLLAQGLLVLQEIQELQAQLGSQDQQVLQVRVLLVQQETLVLLVLLELRAQQVLPAQGLRERLVQ